jgi:hypothetical protein
MVSPARQVLNNDAITDPNSAGTMGCEAGLATSNTKEAALNYGAIARLARILTDIARNPTCLHEQRQRHETK